MSGTVLYYCISSKYDIKQYSSTRIGAMLVPTAKRLPLNPFQEYVMSCHQEQIESFFWNNLLMAPIHKSFNIYVPVILVCIKTAKLWKSGVTLKSLGGKSWEIKGGSQEMAANIN